MKKTITIIVLAVLCLNFNVKAQDNSSTTTALNIGDKVPDLTINNIINYKGADGKTATTAKISDFKGKLLILDFWATWCAPCVAMIPKMDSLQKEFAGQVQFLPVAYESSVVISGFLERYQKQNNKALSLPDATGDVQLQKVFPHTSLPHFVWIDGNGFVKAITEYDFVDKAHIKQYIATGNVIAKIKYDPTIPFDRSKPLLLNGNGGNGDNLLYHSILTSYKVGIPGSDHFDYYEAGKSRRVSAINETIANLFASAFGGDKYWFGNNKRVFLTKDSTKLKTALHGSSFVDWMSNGNGYCYELIVPPSLGKDIFKLMQNDLSRLFPQYDVSVQKIPTMCLALIRTSKIDKIHTKGGQTITDFNRQGVIIKNNYLVQLTGRLDIMYMQNKYPVVDATGYNEPADITIDANLSNLEQLNKELQKYDLTIKESIQPIDMLVFRDRSPITN